ncbi:MAG: hypothetical protein NAOJABEB_01461 [Steroidobacteraceae bacterium]|nr:hypothetical protein [Steroidobacteraceae bacterium]
MSWLRTTGAAFIPLMVVMSLVPAAHATGRLAQVDIHDRTADETLSVYRRWRERWIAGVSGHEYAIRVRNESPGRVLAVVSVDGVNVVTGRTAAPSQSGYVIEPGQSVSIDGWRKSLAQTAAFVFTDPSRSYATRTGRPADVGVIGVALFRERETPIAQILDESKVAAERRAAPGAPTAAAQSLGTGHGRGEYSPAERTTFERASEHPDEVVVLRYESREQLVAMGILPRPRVHRSAPNPFPAAQGFVPDP